MSQKCFFTYCWDDSEAVSHLMDYMKTDLEKKSQRNIRVMIDKKSLHVAENYTEFEKQINKSDSVVIFFTPNYKRIVDSKNTERGVFREYEYILNAYRNNSISVIPIVVKGGRDKAVTSEFRQNVSADFTGKDPMIKKAGKSKGYKLNSLVRSQMKNLITDIIYETARAHRRKDYTFSNREEAYTVLFCNTDSKNKLPKGCMYKSQAYSNIMTFQGTSFLVGRKGSGKTTFFEVLEKYDTTEFDKRYKVLRPISVEDIREDNLYSVIENYSNDSILFGDGIIIELFWEIYLYLCSIYIVCVEEENHRIRDERQPQFHKITNKLKNILNVKKLDSTDVKRAIFTESVSLWEDFIKTRVLDYATEKAFFASMDANFNVNNVLIPLFGKKDYNNLISCIEQCDRKILVVLDKFDTISDDFRRKIKQDLNSNDERVIESAKKRAEFDGLLYRSLITAVEKLRSVQSGIMENVMFCVIIPQDRVDQIRMIDRDFAKREFKSLSWDAVELLEVILLRLSFLFSVDVNINEDCVEQFQSIMKKYLPTIPLYITIDINGTDKEIDLFQYLLRISFWRPRDIIKYFAVLYDANTKNKNRHDVIDMETLKGLLNSVTEEIIQDEFFSEYNKVFYNIKQLLERFEKRNVVMALDEFLNIVNNFEFEGVVFNNKYKLLEKLELLYEIGIFGLQFTSDYIREKGICHKLCFIFNEGMNPFVSCKKDISRRNKSIQIVLNPIFGKRLSLKYNTTQIIGNYGWKYLLSNHSRKMTINRL